MSFDEYQLAALMTAADRDQKNVLFSSSLALSASPVRSPRNSRNGFATTIQIQMLSTATI